MWGGVRRIEVRGEARPEAGCEKGPGPGGRAAVTPRGHGKGLAMCTWNVLTPTRKPEQL